MIAFVRNCKNTKTIILNYLNYSYFETGLRIWCHLKILLFGCARASFQCSLSSLGPIRSSPTDVSKILFEFMNIFWFNLLFVKILCVSLIWNKIEQFCLLKFFLSLNFISLEKSRTARLVSVWHLFTVVEFPHIKVVFR